MALRVFASAWGNATHWGSLRRLMDGLKVKGFAGLEASLSDLGKDADARRDVATQARDRGLELIVGLYSHWTDYEGTWAPASPAEHLDQLRRQVDACAALDPIHVNVHAGCDSWPEDVSTRFYEDAQAIVLASADINHDLPCSTASDALVDLRTGSLKRLLRDPPGPPAGPRVPVRADPERRARPAPHGGPVALARRPRAVPRHEHA